MVADIHNAYAPPRSVVADPSSASADGELELAGRGVRLGAFVIDAVLLFGALGPAYAAAVRAMMLNIGSDGVSSGGSAAFFSALANTGAWLYGGLALASIIAIVNAVLVHRNGQSIGKHWLGIKVLRKDGSRAGLARIFWLRNVVNGLFGYIPVVGRLYGLVDALLIFRADRRCCHDLIADTIVVRA
jgi:uncharacterized RDD family membrane protein YckC